MATPICLYSCSCADEFFFAFYAFFRGYFTFVFTFAALRLCVRFFLRFLRLFAAILYRSLTPSPQGIPKNDFQSGRTAKAI